MDHGQLEVRVGVVDGDAAGLCDEDDGERRRGERPAKAEEAPGVTIAKRDDLAEARALRLEGERGQREHQHRLDERADRQLAAASHLTEGAAAVHAAERQQGAPERQQPDDDESGRRSSKRRARAEDGHKQRAARTVAVSTPAGAST